MLAITDLLNVTFFQLQHSEVVVSLSMIIIGSQSQTETLVCQSKVTNTLKHKPNVNTLNTGMSKQGHQYPKT